MTPLTDDGFLSPYLPAQDYLWPAWFGCLHWAVGDPDVVAAFRADTGEQWTPGRSPLAQMIDTATGADKAFFVAFAQWMNANIWGEG